MKFQFLLLVLFSVLNFYSVSAQLPARSSETHFSYETPSPQPYILQKNTALQKNTLKFLNKHTSFRYDAELEEYSTDTHIVYNYKWNPDGTPDEAIGYIKTRKPMMKIVMSGFIKFSEFYEYASDIPGYVSRNVTYYNLDSNGVWVPGSREIYEVDSILNLGTGRKYENFRDNKWVPRRTTSFHYDSLKNFTGFIETEFNNDTAEITYGSLNTYYYNTQDFITHVKSKFYSTTDKIWLNGREEFYTLNNKGEIKTINTYYHNSRGEKIYDSINVYGWRDFSNTIKLKMRDYSRNVLATRSFADSMVNYRKTPDNNEYEPGYRIISTFDADNNRTSVTTKIIVDNEWQNSRKEEMSYYKNKNLKTHNDIRWQNNIMHPYSASTYGNTYDSEGDIIQSDHLTEYFYGTSSRKEGNSNLFEYTIITNTGLNNPAPHALSIFPNPANDLLSIRLPANYRAANITITDLAGKVLLLTNTNSSANNISVNIQSLPQGFYLVRLENNNAVYTAKFIKQ